MLGKAIGQLSRLCDSTRPEDRRQRSEVRRQKAEVRRQRSDTNRTIYLLPSVFLSLPHSLPRLLIAHFDGDVAAIADAGAEDRHELGGGAAGVEGGVNDIGGDKD